MNRRGFLGFLGLTGVAAPTVKQALDAPDSEKQPAWAAQVASNPAPAWASWLDVQDGVLYDRVRFEAGSTLPMELRFFACPAGQICPYSGVMKTYKHTNLHMYGVLAAPNEFLVRSILFAAHPSVADADLQAVSREGEWEFQLGHKVMSRAPMLLNGPARAGLRDIVTPQKDRDIRTKIRPDLPEEVIQTARHNRTTGGTYIMAQMYFAFIVRFCDRPVTLLSAKDGGRGIDMLIGFEGLDARAVQ